MKKKYVGLLILLFVITACAPVVHTGGYTSQRSSTGHFYIHHDSQYIEHDNRYAYNHRYYPIEVTLYSDRVYGGLSFQPIHFIFYDGDYVQIPIKDRRGRHARIYAHYHRGDLHFDRDKNCNNLRGASRFRYDQRWDKGYLYDHISAGHEFDLSGLRLNVRKHTEKKRTERKKSLVNKNGFHDSHDKRKRHQRPDTMRAVSTSAGIGRDKTKQKVSYKNSVDKNNVRKVKKVKPEIELSPHIAKHQKHEKLRKQSNKQIQTEKPQKQEKIIKRSEGKPDKKKSIPRKTLNVKQHLKNKHEKSSKSKSRNNTKKKERQNEEEKTDTVQGYVANSEQNNTRRVKFKHINH